MKLFFHLDFVEDAQSIQSQISQEEIALEISQTALTEKDFQMTKLNVFHVHHIPDLKTMELIVLLMHATPTKLLLFRVLAQLVQLVLDQIKSDKDVMQLLIVMLEKDFQTTHVFHVMLIQEHKVIMLSVLQIHVQLTSKLTLMEDVFNVNLLPFLIAQRELALNHNAVEDLFLKETELVENAHNIQLQMMLEELVLAKLALLVLTKDLIELVFAKCAQLDTFYQQIIDSVKKISHKLQLYHQFQLLVERRMYLYSVSVHLIDFWVRMIKMMKFLSKLDVLMMVINTRAKIIISN